MDKVKQRWSRYPGVIDAARRMLPALPAPDAAEQARRKAEFAKQVEAERERRLAKGREYIEGVKRAREDQEADRAYLAQIRARRGEH